VYGIEIEILSNSGRAVRSPRTATDLVASVHNRRPMEAFVTVRSTASSFLQARSMKSKWLWTPWSTVWPPKK